MDGNLIAKVAVELSLDIEFEYIVPERLKEQVKVGSLVYVPFSHTYSSGVVLSLTSHTTRKELKEICSVIGNRPLLSENILKLARWMADYYCASIEQSIRTVLPYSIRKGKAKSGQEFFIEISEKGKEALEKPADFKLTAKVTNALEILSCHKESLPLNAFLEMAGVSRAFISNLHKKSLINLCKEERRREQNVMLLPTQPLALNNEQAKALELIKSSINTLQPPVVLLHGVTASGKTEVYLQAIQFVLELGKGAIVLVPEISLTPQTIERFKSRFGDRVAVLHSRLSEGERRNEWFRSFENKADVVVGPRSALFAPIANLGIIIVDEEHDTSYKQQEAPRYNARDIAVMRGHIEGCSVLLGSATPSLESIYNVKAGKYGLSVMKKRVDSRKLPEIQIVDMRREISENGKLPVLSKTLVKAIEERLAQSEQIMLFLNRRGFATSIICPKCGNIEKCSQCDVTLTFHKSTNLLKCHICGLVKKSPETCQKCLSPTLKFSGIGTERVEKIIAELFPNARTLRMDRDTTIRKDSYDKILSQFRCGRADILIGTQMIAKGHDFPGVTLVGIIVADISLNIPDFRSEERTFQLLLQMAGRAGRGELSGEVIIQTFAPNNRAIRAAAAMQESFFYEDELFARKELFYPPYSHFVCVGIEAKEASIARQVGMKIKNKLLENLPSATVITGPVAPVIQRAMGYFREHLLIRTKSVLKISQLLRAAIQPIKTNRSLRITVDIDALSTL